MAKKLPVTLYHNPKCGTSRNALELLRAEGYQPEVVEYMKTGWDMETLKALLKKAGVRAHDILRSKEPIASELGLSEKSSEAEILKAMVAHPVLVNRPIVATPDKAKLCRPAEGALELLED